MGIRDIDTWRKVHLAIAELIDAWRIIPRLLVGGYAYFIWHVSVWYMNLQPYILDKCVASDITKCIINVPTTQHTALISTVVGFGAVVVGLYTNSGKKWNGFIPWNKPKQDEKTKED